MASKNIIKNITCATLGLFFISLSLLIMTKIYFQNQISSQIQNISILKDIRYPTWGKHPNPTGSSLKQTFTLFSQEQIDGQIHSTRSNVSKVFQYMFEYQNTSFAQGNSGRLNFINKWELKQITDNAPSQNIKTINLAADKIFNYDFYAPPQRKFAILYNYISDVLSNSFLEKFYTVYLYKFFFQHKDLVIDTVFKPLGFTIERATQIYENPSFGWSNVDTFQDWVVLSLKGAEEAKKMNYYQSLLTDMGLKQHQVKGLIFQKSTLYNMISALNGTIKSKLMMPGAANFNYKCQKTSCTNSELVAFQIATSFLTNDPLFASLNLNMGTKQLNSTFLADIEYQKFCDQNKGKFICMQKANMVKFFTHNYLGDFQKMDLLWKNQNNYDFIQKQFDLSNNTAQSVVKYVLNLYDNLIGKYEKVYAWSQTTYNNIEPVVMTYKNLFLVELYSRAYFNKFISKKDVDCEKYFVGDYVETGKIVCSSQKVETQSWNFVKYLSSLRKFMGAYLYIQNERSKMSQELGLSYQQLITFFNDDSVSLFAKELKQIEAIFKSSFGCSKNDLELCTPEQLFCMQWGSNQIFQNLPTQIFENKIKSITQWDYQNLLKGLNPDYHAIIGKDKSVKECLSILSSDSSNGIFSLFNILKTAQNAYQNSSDNDILKYASKNVMTVGFNGILNVQDVNSLFNGYKSDLITKKNKMSVQSGGAPWLQNQLKLIKTDNKAQIKNNQLLSVPQFDTIDTGIYDQDRTREISKVWGQTKSSSKYTVYRGTKTDDDGNQIPVDIFKKYVTNRKVQGTNILGFHPNIEEGQNLKIFVNFAYQSMVMSYDSTVEFENPDELKKPLKAYKYKIIMNDGQSKDSSFIGIQELNQNFISFSSQSFAIVEPTTGLTLEFQMEYTVKSNPLYTSFLLDSKNKIDLFSSKLVYRRKSLTEIQSVINDQNLEKSLMIATIVAGSISLVLSFGLIILYCRLKKGSKEMQQSLMENDETRSDL